ncbi:MAG: hypothetical protein Q9201_005312 [Fulgogasparrea decipioides]
MQVDYMAPANPSQTVMTRALTEDRVFHFFPKLPPELRAMIYKHHFLQSPSHSNACFNRWACESAEPEFGCTKARFNNNVPIRELLLPAQGIYKEAAPLLNQLHSVEFDTVHELGQFLRFLGPARREHITTVKFVYDNYHGTPAQIFDQTFRLLIACPNLRKLYVIVYSHHLCRQRSLKGLRTFCGIRGITWLKVHFLDQRNDRSKCPPRRFISDARLKAAEKAFMGKIKILKDEYEGAALRGRAGLIAAPRTFTLPAKNNLQQFAVKEGS